jgi:hypothetical protein
MDARQKTPRCETEHAIEQPIHHLRYQRDRKLLSRSHLRIFTYGVS